MPELPEVETMVRGLRPALRGRTLRSVAVLDPFLLQGCSAEEFERRCRGAKVGDVGRRGKWVVMTLAAGRGIIVIQPRMSGGFRVGPAEPPTHARLAFDLGGSGRPVWFCDTRRLGKVAWYRDSEEAGRAFERSHGPDALEISVAELGVNLGRTGRGIKPTLLDQKVLAGIGNIYADEILFHAGIHPERPASGLSEAEVGRIHEAIGRVLRRAIELEGSSFDGNYRTVLGREGGYLKQSVVHWRKGEACRRCSTPVVKARIAGLIGRPTYYCPTCQPAARGPSGRRGGDRLS